MCFFLPAPGGSNCCRRRYLTSTVMRSSRTESSVKTTRRVNVVVALTVCSMPPELLPVTGLFWK